MCRQRFHDLSISNVQPSWRFCHVCPSQLGFSRKIFLFSATLVAFTFEAQLLDQDRIPVNEYTRITTLVVDLPNLLISQTATNLQASWYRSLVGFDGGLVLVPKNQQQQQQHVHMGICYNTTPKEYKSNQLHNSSERFE